MLCCFEVFCIREGESPEFFLHLGEGSPTMYDPQREAGKGLVQEAPALCGLCVRFPGSVLRRWSFAYFYLVPMLCLGHQSSSELSGLYMNNQMLPFVAVSFQVNRDLSVCDSSCPCGCSAGIFQTANPKASPHFLPAHPFSSSLSQILPGSEMGHFLLLSPIWLLCLHRLGWGF